MRKKCFVCDKLFVEMKVCAYELSARLGARLSERWRAVSAKKVEPFGGRGKEIQGGACKTLMSLRVVVRVCV